MALRCCILAGALCLTAGGAMAAPDPAQAQVHLREANVAFEAGDYATSMRSLETALQLNPGSEYTRYFLARAYARAGRFEPSLALLERLAAARIDFGVADDPDLASMAQLPRFQALVARLRAATRPHGEARRVHAFDQLGLIPEGIAYDAASERAFFGSMRSGQVFVVDRYGQLSEFAAVRHRGPLAAIGMTVDAERGLLWVVGASFFLTVDHDPQAPIESGVFGFDLASGQLKTKLLGHDVGNGYNDVTLGPDGELYLSGSVISSVAPGADAIVPLATEIPIFGSNGIVATPDGEHLITSSYPVGIAVIRLADGAVHFLEAPPTVSLYGIDGMYGYRGDLIAIQNGLSPWRLLRLKLTPDLRAVEAAIDLDFANPAMTATTGAIADDRMYYLGQEPQPADVPAHFPEATWPYLGRTVIMAVSLD